MLNSILYPLEYVVAFIMVHFHAALTTVGLPEASGWTWALSIVGLVIVIRIILIPLFVKQIKASRGLQLIQPEMKKIQAKYKDKKDPESRQAMTQETMALYKNTGTNPFSSCLPILLQAPIFFALLRVLNDKVQKQTGIGPLTPELARMADNSTLLGAPLSSTFIRADGNHTVQIITVVLIILMSASTFTTQRQLMMKNMPAAALDNPFAQQQKILLYVLPLVFAVSGVNFPIGVLLYWLTTNVWSMGQQFYVIRRMPAPGSLAEQALEERRRRKGKTVVDESAAGTDVVTGEVVDEVPRQRAQPKRQPRSKRAPRPAGPEVNGASAGRAAASPESRAVTPEPKRPAATGRGQGTPSAAGATAAGATKPSLVKSTSGGAPGQPQSNGRGSNGQGASRKKPASGSSVNGKSGSGKPGSGNPTSGKPGSGSAGKPAASNQPKRTLPSKPQ